MAVQIRKGGSWQNITGCQVYANGAWRTIVAIKVYRSGAWRTVGNFTAPPPAPSGGGSSGGGGGGSSGGGGGGTITVMVSPTSVTKTGVNASQTSASITVTPSGGLAPYTYACSFVSQDGNATYVINTPTLASTTVTASGLGTDTPSTCSIHWVVTDSLGTSATSATVPITFDRVSTA
jgi:hypothetical protein